MKFPKAAKLEQAINPSDCRHSISECYLDTTEEGTPFLVATDGRILARVPVQATKEEGGHVSAVALKAARKQKTQDGKVELICNGKLELPTGESFPRSMELGRFPNWRQVLPKAKLPGTFKIALNPTLLKKLADAIGAETVALEITHAKPLAPIRVTPMQGDAECKDAVGVIMPCKV